jgi:coenzyme Q-binding protein COQ10
MPHASKSIDVDVPSEHFVAVLLDYARYPEFIHEVKSLRVEPREGCVWVTYTLDAKLMLVEYTLEHTQIGPLRLEWKLVRGEFFRANSGFWTLEPFDEGRHTRVTYSIDLQLGTMPASFQNALRETGLPRLLANFKGRAEATWKARKKASS